jgi:tRNA A-37 threonylcarbamoyl transferase component Bud32
MQYIPPEWQAALEKNNLNTFDAIWELSLPNVDRGNYGRGGFSVVSRYALTMPNGEQQTIYIKRQEDYLCFNPRQPWKRMPTFAREFKNWQRFRKLNIPTFDVVYFATRDVGEHQQAILITKEIPGVDLTKWLTEMQPSGNYSFAQKCAVTKTVAEVMQQLHQPGLKHGHLSPIHIFVNVKPDKPWPEKLQGYFIDLELLRWYPWNDEHIKFDLSMLCRRSPRCSRTQYMRFFKYYLNIPRLTPKAKRLWRTVSTRVLKRWAKKQAMQVPDGG